MSQFGAATSVFQANYESGRIARSACERFTTPAAQRLAIGVLGPTLFGANHVAPESKHFDELVAAYIEQVSALWLGGVDVFHIEGCQSVEIGRAAFLAIRTVEFKIGKPLPTLVTACLEATGRMLDGNSYIDLYEMAQEYAPLACGVSGFVGTLAEVPIGQNAIPGAVFGRAFEPGLGWANTPESLAKDLLQLARDQNIFIIGISGPSSPEYIHAIADRLPT